MVPEFYEFYNPTRIIFSRGISRDFSTELSVLGKKKYFIVTDRTIEKTGHIERIKTGLKSAGIEITGEYKEVKQDAELEGINRCSEIALSSGAGGLIAVGGGSVIDTAKAANVLISEGGNLLEDYSGSQTLTRPLKPLVAVPTTAGTGSEATLAAVVYDKANNIKVPLTDKFLLPDLAVLDPELTLTLPPELTASTAVDALTHAIEAFTGLQWSPYSDALALGAVQLIFSNIKKAAADGSDIDARSALQAASNMAGIAFSHSMVGCVHAMAHTLGGICHVPHGDANAILLPYGMEYNLDTVYEKYAKLAPFIGIPQSGQSSYETAETVIEAVKKLMKELNGITGLPFRLRDAGVSEDLLPEIAEGTAIDGSVFYNPKEVTAEEILLYLKKAY